MRSNRDQPTLRSLTIDIFADTVASSHVPEAVAPVFVVAYMGEMERDSYSGD